MKHRLRAYLTSAALLAFVGITVAYKIDKLGYDPHTIFPETQYRVTYALALDGHGEDVQVRTFLPASDVHQQVTDERNLSGPLGFATSTRGMNRIATWSGNNVPDGGRVEYSFTVTTRAMRYELDPGLAVPAIYPPEVTPYLAPEEDIQVDHPDIGRTLDALGARSGSVEARLQKIFDFTSGLRQRPFKGTTDALTALRLGEASCNGKSRLFVALARAAGIPTRLVGGIVLTEGSKKTSHQWVEAYAGGHWVPFCPTNGHFALLPDRYLRLYTGDEVLFGHTADINFEYAFVTDSSLVPSQAAKSTLQAFNVWAMFERLGLPFSLLRTVLMLPIGALVVVFFRNVIGMPTFGTFLPALVAASANETGLAWGLLGVLIVVVLVAVVRRSFHALELLHSPSLAILLTSVTLTMLATSLVAEHVGVQPLAHLSVFPIAVLAITAERFYLSWTEQGMRRAVKELAGTMLVIAGCNVVMRSLALQVLISAFPEILLAVVAVNIHLGRWVGVRLLEYLRFRHVLAAESPR